MTKAIIANLTTLLLAEKEEKRQLYNRLKNTERQRDMRDQEARFYRDRDQTMTQEVKQLREENAGLDKMCGELHEILAEINKPVPVDTDVVRT